jgi:hypothetical protein
VVKKPQTKGRAKSPLVKTKAIEKEKLAPKKGGRGKGKQKAAEQEKSVWDMDESD